MDIPRSYADGNGTPDLESVLHMNTGNGTNSYSANSSGQRNIMLRARPILEDSVKRTYSKTLSESDQFVVADLGCGSGSNSLEAATAVIEAIIGSCHRTGKSPPEILVFLNDLPGNDFNSLSMALPTFYESLKKKDDEEKNKLDIGSKCFVCAMPGSFYRRLFPSRSLHFVHSSYSIHWLSQVPNGLEHNKGSICMASTSRSSVCEAYLKQFHSDFMIFLSSRAQEIIPQGQMVLTFAGRVTSDPRDKGSCFQLELLSKCLLDMAAEGLVEELDINSFNLPFYPPCEEELRDLVERQGSFTIDKLETFQGNIGPFGVDDEDIKLATAHMVALNTRAVAESMLTNHFGGGLMMSDLFERCERKIVEYLTLETPICAFIILSATKI